MVIKLDLDPPLAVGETFEIEREYVPDANMGAHIPVDVGSQHRIGAVIGVDNGLVKIKIVRVYGCLV